MSLQGEIITAFVAAVGTIGTTVGLVAYLLRDMKSEIQELRSEVRAELRSEVGGLRSDMSSEIGALRSEMGQFPIRAVLGDPGAADRDALRVRRRAL